MKTNWKTKLTNILKKDEFPELPTKSLLRITAETTSGRISAVIRSSDLRQVSKNSEIYPKSDFQEKTETYPNSQLRITVESGNESEKAMQSLTQSCGWRGWTSASLF